MGNLNINSTEASHNNLQEEASLAALRAEIAALQSALANARRTKSSINLPLVSSYDINVLMTIEDAVENLTSKRVGKFNKQEASFLVKFGGVFPKEQFRPKDKKGGRGVNLYKRSDLEKVISTLDSYRQ